LDISSWSLQFFRGGIQGTERLNDLHKDSLQSGVAKFKSLWAAQGLVWLLSPRHRLLCYLFKLYLEARILTTGSILSYDNRRPGMCATVYGSWQLGTISFSFPWFPCAEGRGREDWEGSEKLFAQGHW
jgi:hypothetical protein